VFLFLAHLSACSVNRERDLMLCFESKSGDEEAGKLDPKFVCDLTTVAPIDDGVVTDQHRCLNPVLLNACAESVEIVAAEWCEVIVCMGEEDLLP